VYLTAQQLAIANQAVVETFENTCIAWQVIPHWNTGDPGQSRVRDDVVDKPGFLNLDLESVEFQLTLVQTSAPSSDSLIAEVNSAATELARLVDANTLATLGLAAFGNHTIPFLVRTDFLAPSQQALLDNLIDARAYVEDSGYRAPSCLVTNTQGLKYLNALNTGYPITEALLESAHVNSLHRTSLYDATVDAVNLDGTSAVKNGNPVPDPATVMVMLGRRQLIAHGAAPDASPGEEPVDLAVSVLPSLEVVGETTNSEIELSVRVRFALRVKDPKSLVLLWGTPVYVP
jgi:hypothetical protein